MIIGLDSLQKRDDEEENSSEDEDYVPGAESDASEERRGERSVGKSAAKNSSEKRKTPAKRRKKDDKLVSEDEEEDGTATTGGPGVHEDSKTADETVRVASSGNGVTAPTADPEDTASPSEPRNPPRKSAIDDIWASMNSAKPAQKRKPVTPGFDASWLTATAPAKSKPSPPAASTLLADSLGSTPTKPAAFKEGGGETGASAESANPAPKNEDKGLDTLVAGLNQKKKKSILDRSRSDWSQFKKDNEVEDELDSHKKDKNRFTDRVAFLQRVELREWQAERDRKSRR